MPPTLAAGAAVCGAACRHGSHHVLCFKINASSMESRGRITAFSSLRDV